MLHAQKNFLILTMLASTAYLACGQMQQLSVTDFDFNWAGAPGSANSITKAFQGSSGTSVADCYVSNMWQEPSATLYFDQHYMVEKLRFLNRNDAAQRLTGIEIDVCSSEDDKCHRCSTTGVTPESTWTSVDCPLGGIKGDRIRLLRPGNEHLQFCEIEIYGSPATTVTPASQMQLAVTDWEFNPAGVPGSANSITKAFQGSIGTSVDECYVSNMWQDPWAKLYFDEEYMVERLRFLNRDDAAQRLTGMEIDVCSSEHDNCHRCATTGVTPESAWTSVECPNGGLKGDHIKLLRPGNEHLQFCELEIYGSPIGAVTVAPVTCPVCPQVCPTSCPVCPPDTPSSTAAVPTEAPVCPEFADPGISIISCDSIKVKKNSGSCSSAYDGSLVRDVKSGNCFVSQSNKKGWIEVMLERTTKVGSVVILPKGNGDGLNGANVEVCVNNEDNCKKLATVGKVDKSGCNVISGAPKTGNMVRISITGSNLVICEMKIYPN